MEENNQTTSIAIKVNSFSTSAKFFLGKLTEKIKIFSESIIARIKNFKLKSTNINPTLGYQNQNQNRNLNFNLTKIKSFYKIIITSVVLVLLLIAFFVGRSTSGNSYSTYADNRPLGPTIKAQEILNKEYDFPLLDDKGVKVSEIKYKIKTADLEDSIIVNGQKANAVKGRTFLVLNLEITNNHTQAIQINSRDYIRLMANGQAQLIAPDIHNDPVTVQAISTKITRLGFPINDTDKDLKLQIGEIKGDKQTLKLNF